MLCEGVTKCTTLPSSVSPHCLSKLLTVKTGTRIGKVHRETRKL